MVSRVHFLECAGNSAANALSPTALDQTLGELAGEVSCSEWTGVPLSYLLNEAGLKDRARVFCTASNGGLLESLRPHGLVVLRHGQISGLNGVLLSAALEAGIEGACLLGEMPHMFAQLPYPKA